MDNAVALVRAYLHVNGYFTVTEYPVIEALKHGGYRTATDLDVLGFRFPGAGRIVPAGGGRAMRDAGFAPDPELGAPGEQPDMLIGEVKEGRAELNPAARDPEVLAAALARFGCCPPEAAPGMTRDLLRRGRATLPSGHLIRMVVFGSLTGPEEAAYEAISVGHVVRFLQEYLREHLDVLRHAQFKDPAFGFLVTLEKALRSADW